MQEYLQKTHVSAVMDEIGALLALLIISLSAFFLLWGVRPMSLLAGTAAFILALLLRSRGRERRLRQREARLRRRIGGELCLEGWTVCPPRRAHLETARLLSLLRPLAVERVTDAGALCRLPGEETRALIACAQSHRAEKLTARNVAAFQRSCLRYGAEKGYLCGAPGATAEAREQCALAPRVILVDRERMIALAGAAAPATDAQLVALGQRNTGGRSLKSLLAAALDGGRAEKYLLYGLLLTGLHLLTGQQVYRITGLICLGLTAVCRCAAQRRKNVPLE